MMSPFTVRLVERLVEWYVEHPANLERHLEEGHPPIVRPILERPNGTGRSRPRPHSMREGDIRRAPGVHRGSESEASAEPGSARTLWSHLASCDDETGVPTGRSPAWWRLEILGVHAGAYEQPRDKLVVSHRDTHPLGWMLYLPRSVGLCGAGSAGTPEQSKPVRDDHEGGALVQEQPRR